MPTVPVTNYAGIEDIGEAGQRFRAPCDSCGAQILRSTRGERAATPRWSAGA
jgi:hypothetical protein